MIYLYNLIHLHPQKLFVKDTMYNNSFGFSSPYNQKIQRKTNGKGISKA